MGTGRGDSAALCINVFILTQSGGNFTSVAVMKTFYYFFYKFFFSLDKARDLPSICGVHSPPILSLSSSGRVMELPLTAALREVHQHSEPGSTLSAAGPHEALKPRHLLRNFWGNEVSPCIRLADGCKQVVWALSPSF